MPIRYLYMRNDAYRDISINNGPSRQIVHTILCAR